MTAFRRIVLAAVCAGLAAGAVLTALQTASVLPMIAAAEHFEAGGHGHRGGEAGAETAHGIAPGLTLTLAANVLAGVAFALLLVAALSLAPPADWRLGLAWGAAGFIAFALAPAAGLPPNLPGVPAAEPGARQLWWAATAAATAGGLALAAFVPALWARAGAVVLVLAPHAVGAPGGGHAGHDSALPEGLAASFVGASLAASLVFWLVVGGLGAYAFSRLEGGASAGARSMR